MPPVSATRNGRLADTAVRGPKRVHHQHRNRQRTHATGNRRERAGDVCDARVHVADQHAALFGEPLQAGMTLAEDLLRHRSIRHRIHTDIDHCRTRPHEIASDERGPTDCRHQDVSLSAHPREIRRLRMTNRYRGIAVEQQDTHRLTDDVAAADDYGMASGYLDIFAL